MKMLCTLFMTAGLVCAAQAQASASEETAFLKSLEGNWAGSGTVKPRIGSAPIGVRCSFETRENADALSMQGTCRGMILISRSIGADIKVDGTRYSGVYIGPAGGRSALSGSRQGEAINLAIRWANEVNGDRNANLTVERVGSTGMVLKTVDTDPASGEAVVTSEINLQRR